MIKYAQGQIIICTDSNYLNKVFKECGQVGIPVYPENFRWVPFRYKWDKENNINYPKYTPRIIVENNEEDQIKNN